MGFGFILVFFISEIVWLSGDLPHIYPGIVKDELHFMAFT